MKLFFMVNMVSGMDHGRMRLATTTTSHNMAAIQLIPSHSVLDYSMSLMLDIHIMFDSSHMKRSTDQYHVTI